MIKNILKFLLIMVVAGACNPEVIQFKTEIKPNKSYSRQQTNSTNSSVDFTADEETLQLIEDNGYQLPIKTDLVSILNSEIISDKRNDQGEFLASKQYGKVNTTTTINGRTQNEKQPYSGMKILGKYDVKNKYIIDSIIGVKLLPQMKYFHNVVIENIYNKIKFPNHGMRIGDTIHNEMAIDIPMQGMQPVKSLIKMQYIFEEIKDGKAIFILNQKAMLDKKWGQENTELNGIGKGMAEFDLDENYLTLHIYELPMELTVVINDKMTANMKITMKSEQVVTIK